MPRDEPPKTASGSLRLVRPLRLAYASPLPPQRTGIADYSAELLPHLARHAQIDLFVDGDAGDAWPGAEAFDFHPLERLPRLRSDYDLVLYQLGNDARFHGAIWRMLQRVPGVVVLHEYMLHHLVRELTLARGDLEGYVEEHRYCYGADVARLVRGAVEFGPPHDIWSYPLFERAVDHAPGLIVHNQTTRRRVLASRPAARIAVVPHHLALGPLPETGSLDAAAVRRRLGVPEGALMVASFGYLTPAKRLEVALRGFRRLQRQVPEAVYVLVGEVSPYYDLDRLLDPELEGTVLTTGRLPLDELLAAMAAADVVVNLRHPTGGETSGTLIRLLGLGKPVIVSDTGSFREIPAGCCARVPLDPVEEDLLAALLVRLAKDPALRRQMGDNARRHMAEHHTLEGSAAGYAAFLEEVMERTGGEGPSEPVPPLAAWPREDAFTELVSAVAGAAADLGVHPENGGDLLAGVARSLVELDLDRTAGVREESP